MYKGFKVIDADSHSMEPLSLWDKYLDPKYRPWAPGGSRKPTVEGQSTIDHAKEGFSRSSTRGRYISDGEGGLLTYGEAYKWYIEQEFSAESYLAFMDQSGIDIMVLYPTAALGLTAGETAAGRQIMSANVADALYQAYNNWLYDFSNQGQGRILGAGGVDLRDANLAAKEARRCVEELGFKALYILPQPALGIPLHDEYYDPLWGTLEELGVPMGIHGLQGSSHIGKDYWGDTFALGRAASSFPMEEQLAFVSLAGGGVLERFPKMKVVFLESSAGWAPYWLWWCDDKWSQRVGLAADQDPITPEPPSFYFKRQCFIAGEPEEPGYQFCALYGLEDRVCTSTDFPHPEDINFPRAMDDFWEGQSKVLTTDQIRKILWDNPAHLYNIS